MQIFFIVSKIASSLKRSIFLSGAIFFSHAVICGEVKSWECSKFENSIILGTGNVYLGKLGPRWLSDSIFNSSSIYAKTWHNESIFNESTKYGNSYSNNSRSTL